MKVFFKISFFLLVFWAFFSFYLIKNAHLIPKVKSAIGLTKGSNDYIGDVEATESVKRFIKVFYVYDRNTVIENNISDISDLLSSQVSKKIIDEYSKVMRGLVASKLMQSVDIKKIVRKVNTNSFIGFFELDQSELDQKGSRQKHLIQVHFDLETDKSKNIYISKIDETLLRGPSDLLLERAIHIDQNITSVIELPCEVKSVLAQTEDSQVAQSTSSDSRRVTFSTNEKSKGSGFKVNCRRKAFHLLLRPGHEYITLYQKVAMSEGRARFKKKKMLTLGEKDAKKALGIISVQ